MANMIIAVGGTGQVLLHYYTQLFLIGSKAVPHPFRAVVVDGDRLMGSLETYSDFFSKVALREGTQHTPNIQYIHIEIPPSNNVRHALTGNGDAEPEGFHPVDAFFSRSAQAQDVREGLFARPCLSAVIGAKWRLPQIALDGVERIVVLGSLIGGTGGGLIAPLIAELQRRAPTAKVVAVLMGEFFQNAGTGVTKSEKVDDARRRFPSNKLMTARSVRDVSGAQLKYLIFIDPPESRRVVRDTDAEQRALNLPWPDETQPYWQALTGVATLTDESLSDRPENEIAELQPTPTKCPYPANWNLLVAAWQRANSLSHKSVLSMIARDPFASRIWGRKLVNLIGSHWEQVRGNRTLNFAHSKSFCDQVQDQLNSWWTKLDATMPSLPVKKTCSVEHLARLEWGEPGGQLAGDVLSSPATVLDTSAAAVLFRALRGGMS